MWYGKGLIIVFQWWIDAYLYAISIFCVLKNFLMKS